ncbi:aspartate/glutamate racemase family protein [Mycetocola sp. 2940]|uniref:aspartate/glutamate racemase family protein n=1 Tax=Mycetocola sp. 2940 TaxID=3156452 RepID=UPI00339AB063
MTRVGLLHTVPALAETFSTALREASPDIEVVDVVDPTLLARAIDEGVTPALEASVASRIDELARQGADAILVTCSSIGEAAEAASAPVPVLRVDAPMADEAVAIARRAAREEARTGRIAVLATLQATIGPTGRLLERAATGSDVTVDVTVVDGAADARTRGDQAEHNRLVLDAILEFADRADVIVLAQASMAAAVADVKVPVPVLTSPEGGVRSLVAAVAGRTGAPGTP